MTRPGSRDDHADRAANRAAATSPSPAGSVSPRSARRSLGTASVWQWVAETTARDEEENSGLKRPSLSQPRERSSNGVSPVRAAPLLADGNTAEQINEGDTAFLPWQTKAGASCPGFRRIKRRVSGGSPGEAGEAPCVRLWVGHAGRVRSLCPGRRSRRLTNLIEVGRRRVHWRGPVYAGVIPEGVTHGHRVEVRALVARHHGVVDRLGGGRRHERRRNDAQRGESPCVPPVLLPRGIPPCDASGSAYAHLTRGSLSVRACSGRL
jgi:hypothetical protein